MVLPPSTGKQMPPKAADYLPGTLDLLIKFHYLPLATEGASWALKRARPLPSHLPTLLHPCQAWKPFRLREGGEVNLEDLEKERNSVSPSTLPGAAPAGGGQGQG